MRITESQLRRMVRYEVRQMLYENTSADKVLTIHSAEWRDEWSVPTRAGENGYIKISFSFGELTKVNLNFKIEIITYKNKGEDEIVEQITKQICEFVKGKLPQLQNSMLPTRDAVRTALVRTSNGHSSLSNLISDMDIAYADSLDRMAY